ncbi:hypothetical protein D9M68_854300 [compost metagenome]
MTIQQQVAGFPVRPQNRLGMNRQRFDHPQLANGRQNCSVFDRGQHVVTDLTRWQNLRQGDRNQIGLEGAFDGAHASP